MAFPVVAASNTSAETSTATTHTVAYPSGIASGHLLIVLIGAAVATTPAGNIPGEFTELAGNTFGTSRVRVYYKIAAGSEGASNTFTTPSAARSAHITLRITGHGVATSAPDISTVATGTSTSPNPASLSPSWGAADTLWIPLFFADDSNTTTGYPETANNISSDSGGATAGVHVAMCTKELNASSYDAGAFTITSKPWGAYTIAIRPVAGETINRTILRLSSSSSLTDS